MYQISFKSESVGFKPLGDLTRNDPNPLCVLRRIYSWQIVYLSSKEACPTISIHKSEIKVPQCPMDAHGQRGNLRKFTSFSCQLQVNAARASHFLDPETCEFCTFALFKLSIMEA